MLKASIKKWVFLATIILFDFLIALRTSLDFFYFFLFFLIANVILSFAWITLEFLLAKVYLVRKIPTRVVEDDYLEVEVSVKNKSLIPLFNFLLADYVGCADPSQRNRMVLAPYLGAHSSLEIKYRTLCPRRGKYRMGPFSIYFFDPWGIFFLKKNYYLYCELYVYPKIFNIQKFPPLVKGNVPWFGIETNRVSGDEHDFFGVREYKPGDPIKRIHWFSTARKNSLIVKEFQQRAFFNATIIFDLNKDKNFGEGKNSVAEYTIRIAASIADYLIQRNMSLEVIAHAGEMINLPSNKGPDHLEDILRALAVAQAESRVNLGELLSEYADTIPTNSTLITIMLDEDWQYLPALLAAEKRDVSLIPVVLIASSFLYQSADQRVIKNAQFRFPKGSRFAPIFISCGEDLGKAFLK
jgi:uncharacterized protein (DUF58 family)